MKPDAVHRRLASAALVLLPLLWVASPSAQLAQPQVLVSMYFVPEATACPPRGYRDAGDDNTPMCPQLTVEDVDAMESQAIATAIARSIPPERLQLGDALMDSIDAFAEDCPVEAPCMDPKRRYSIILAFDVASVNEIDGYPIELRREPPENSGLPAYSVSGTLSARGRWINHQRADSFRPTYRVNWVLQVGQWTWELGTEP